jgi:hypothetical protein
MKSEEIADLARFVATALRVHTAIVTDEMVRMAVEVFFDAGGTRTYRETNVVGIAELDWRAHVGEHDRSPGGGLDRIFRESGWGPCPPPGTSVPDWCGFTVCAWWLRAGLNKAHDQSFYHAKNVEAFFTYGARGNVNPARLRTEVSLPSGWEKVATFHLRAGDPRRWTDAVKIRTTPLPALDFKPGDIVLINHHGKTDEAHHITMVRSWDGRYLERIEGNASYRIGGRGPNGEKWTDSVVTVRMDLADPAQKAKLYGVGRLSTLDCDNREYR